MIWTDCQKRIVRGGWQEDRTLLRCSWPIGPRNTWSNLAYPFAGLAVALMEPAGASYAFALLLTMLGVGSALYHGLKTVFANNLDWFGMYTVMTGLVLNTLWPGEPALAIFFTGMVAGLWFFIKAHFNLVMGAAVLATSLGIWFSGGSLAYMSAGLGAFALAYLCWQLDKRSTFLGLWGHAFWHIFTAGAIALLWLA